MYILTRTSERPKFFDQTYRSIKSQTYGDITHVVSYDTDNTREYLKGYDCIKVPVERETRLKFSHFPYNLYLNKMHSVVSDGWIMYLDDDDVFTRNDAVEIISKHFKDPDAMIVWKVQFPDGTKPHKHVFGRRVASSGFPAISFAFHSKWLKYANWDDRKGSDSRVAHTLFRAIKRVKWIDEVLTKINYESGYGGSGMQHDVS